MNICDLTQRLVFQGARAFLFYFMLRQLIGCSDYDANWVEHEVFLFVVQPSFRTDCTYVIFVSIFRLVSSVPRRNFLFIHLFS